jgi:hypothetical protein
MDSLFLAVIHNLLLWEKGVILDLVDCGHNVYGRHELLQVLATVIADANGSYFAGGKQFLHVFVRIDVGSLPGQVPRAIGMFGEQRVVSCS